MKKLLIATILLVVGISGCKPSHSNLDAITGKDKAFALVSVRNEIRSKAKIVANNSDTQAALKKLNEPVFALVECKKSNGKNGEILAEKWMNYLEFKSMQGLVYVTPERTLKFYSTKNKKIIENDFSCYLVGPRMAMLPVIWKSSSLINNLPAAEPRRGSKDYIKSKAFYDLAQTVFLAMRGPYSDGNKFSLSPAYVGLEEAAANYSAIKITPDSMTIAMTSADQFYNPCYKGAPPKGGLAYLNEWRTHSFSCEDSATAGLKNYRVGGSLNANYVDIRNGIAGHISQLYDESVASKTDTRTRTLINVLTTTRPWTSLQGAQGTLARTFAGTSRKSSSANLVGGSFSLALDQGSAFSLADNTTSTKDLFPNSINDLILQQFGQEGGLDNIENKLLADWSQASEALAKTKGSKTVVGNEAIQYYTNLLKNNSSLGGKFTKLEELRTDDPTDAENYKQKQMEIIANGVKSGKFSLDDFRTTAVFNHLKTDQGVDYYKNGFSDYTTVQNGKENFYKKLKGTGVPGELSWFDSTAQQNSINNNSENLTSNQGLMRNVGWDKDGNGFANQTTTVDDSKNQNFGLQSSFGFVPNEKGSSVGKFVETEEGRESLNQQLTKFVKQHNSINAGDLARAKDLSNANTGIEFDDSVAQSGINSSFNNLMVSLNNGKNTSDQSTILDKQINQHQSGIGDGKYQNEYDAIQSTFEGFQQESNQNIATNAGKVFDDASNAFESSKNFVNDSIQNSGYADQINGATRTFSDIAGLSMGPMMNAATSLGSSMMSSAPVDNSPPAISNNPPAMSSDASDLPAGIPASSGSTSSMPASDLP